jgi:hypothetical protein
MFRHPNNREAMARKWAQSTIEEEEDKEEKE